MRLRRMYAVLFALIAMLLGVAVTETDARGLRAAEAAVSAQVERAAPVTWLGGVAAGRGVVLLGEHDQPVELRGYEHA